MKRKMCMLLLTLMLLVVYSTLLPSSHHDAGIGLAAGGTWIQASDGRWWYKYYDGTYTTSGWEQIDGSWYYFDSSGWMKTGWIYYSGAWYYCSVPNGQMLTGWQYIGTSWYYFYSSGVMCNSSLDLSDEDGERTAYFYSGGSWRYTTALLYSNRRMVDGNKRLEWESYSIYTPKIRNAAAKWNQIHNVIKEVSSSPGSGLPTPGIDVTIMDFLEDSSLYGYASIEYREIGLNYRKLQERPDRLMFTILHELGHALGLAHNDPGDIMSKYTKEHSSLSTNDIQSFHVAYSHY